MSFDISDNDNFLKMAQQMSDATYYNNSVKHLLLFNNEKGNKDYSYFSVKISLLTTDESIWNIVPKSPKEIIFFSLASYQQVRFP